MNSHDLHTESDEYERSQVALKAEIAGLRARVATMDDVLIENSKLRANWLAQSAQYGYSHKASETDQVHISRYNGLLDKYQESETRLEKANILGSKYRDETKVLHEKRQREKQAIRSWQQYHDRLLITKRSAHHDLHDLIVAIESPPLFQTERQDLDGHMSHDIPGTTSPSGTAGEVEDQIMAPTAGFASVILQQRTEQPQEVTTTKDPHQACEAENHGEDVQIEQAQELATTTDRHQAYEAENIGEDAEVSHQHLSGGDKAASHQDPDDLTAGGPNDIRLESGASYWLGSLPPSNPQVSTRGPVIRSSQSTDGEDDISINNSPAKKKNSSAVPSDEPEVISIRSTKRKRTSSRVNNKKTRGEIITIKSEGNSSPMHESAINHLNQTESVDLDEVTVEFTTPRKRTKLSRRSMQLSPREDEYALERRKSLPPAIERHLSAGSRCEPNQFDSLRNTDAPHGHVQQDVQRALRLRATEHNGDTAEHQPPNTALRRLDVNRPVTPRSERSKNASTKHRRGSRGIVIQDLAEDGEQYSRQYVDQPTRHKEPLSPLAAQPLKPKRLNALLEVSSSPNRKMLTPASKSGMRTVKPPTTIGKRNNDELVEPMKGAAKAMHQQATTQSAKLESPLSTGRARLRDFDKLEALISPTKAAITTDYSTKTTPAPRPPRTGRMPRPSTAVKTSAATPQTGKLKTPLTKLKPISSHGKSAASKSIRKKAVEELKPHDFRINTEANFGHDHAFTDVVRKQDARHCLPGCTKPECCGEHFRKMVELGGLKPASRGMWEPTSSQETEEDRVLRDYMGYNAGIIATLSKQEKEELLTKARTEQFAKRVSRHRAQWERAQSPPGFWNTDFPTTQEAAGYKTEAEKREMAEVLERRREAMRPGGKWKFADE